MPQISVFIVCQDEAPWIEACIRSCALFEEIVVVDSGSTDGTIEIIERLAGEGFPIRLHRRPWPGYARQKQFAMEQCSGEWRLCLDADERLDPALVDAVFLATKQTGHSAFLLRFKPHVFGFGYAPDAMRDKYLERLFRRGTTRYGDENLVHEAIHITGTTGRVREGYILHRRSLPITQLVAKSSRYSELKATQIHNQGGRPRYARLFFNPLLFFLKMYVSRGFFRCGWPGFIHSVYFAIYSFTSEARIVEMAKVAAMGDEKALDDMFLRMVPTKANDPVDVAE